MREMPVKKAAEFIQETDTWLWRILARHVAMAYKQLDFGESTCIGVDELACRKGHNYVTIFADLVAKRVLYSVPRKDSSTWKAFARELEKHSAKAQQIECVSMDMSGAFKKGAAETCPQAEVVFDKYHLIAKTNKAAGAVAITI